MLALAIHDGCAFSARHGAFLENAPLAGGVVIEPVNNEIAWLGFRNIAAIRDLALCFSNMLLAAWTRPVPSK